MGVASSGDRCFTSLRAIAPHTIHVHDSKQNQGPRLALSLTAWAGFVSGVPELGR
ncbi:DUF397 domain-containing protein [Streptomyces sp. NPDC056948]|uniref:DUF397 domain-containing protein n=1 Tax=Streptomyces sp. NPDC056948 TaxID=3345975 RepID=UPI00363BB29A